MAKYGLTESLVTRALVSDIKAKPKRRIKELELGADILGMRQRAEQPNSTNILVVNITGESSSRYAVRPTQNPS